MSDNHFFAEQELCNGRLNDRIVDKRRKLNEPKHWRATQSVRSERVVSNRGGVTRVQVDVECSPLEPFVENAALLVGLCAEVRATPFLYRRRQMPHSPCSPAAGATCAPERKRRILSTDDW